MNNIKVTLAHAPTAEDLGLMTGAARMTQVRGLMPDGEPLNVKLLGKLLKMGHTSVLEHASFSVIIDGATRVFLAQITRHRIASYTSASQQYQLHDGFNYLEPPWDDFPLLDEAEREELKAVYADFMDMADGVYVRLEKALGRDWARYVLPGACRNVLLITATLREWFTIIFPQRLCRRNTPETILIAGKALGIAADNGMEELCKHTGPACITRGYCDQGSMACGRPYKNWKEMLL